MWSRRALLAALATATAATCVAGGALAAATVSRSATAPRLVLAALVRALLAFDDPAFPPVSARDIEYQMNETLLQDPAYVAGLSALDATASAAVGKAVPFSELPLGEARRALAAWLAGPRLEQRAFVAQSKTVAFLALYANPKAWSAIGYAGPFDGSLT